MKTSFITKLMPLSAIALAIAPLHAATPHETFTQLQQAEPTMIIENSAPILQALTPLPSKTEGLIIIQHLGETLRAMSVPCSDEKQEEMMESIGCLALSAAEGSAQSLQNLLSIVMQASTTESLENLEELWINNVKESYEETIFCAFEQDLRSRHEQLCRLLKETSIAPIYGVLTASAGKESEFDSLYQHILQRLSKETEKEDSQLQKIECQGYTILQIPRKMLLSKLLSYRQRENDQLTASIGEGNFYLLVKKQDTVISLIFCSDPVGITLPTSEKESLLGNLQCSTITPTYALPTGITAAKLDDKALTLSADTKLMHMWLSPALQQAYLDSFNQTSDTALAPTIATVFTALAETDEANAEAFKAAAKGIKQALAAFFSPMPILQKPSTLTIWQMQDDVCVQCVYDALGLHYEEGELRLHSLAAEPTTQLYIESTAISGLEENPAFNDLSLYDFSAIVKGVVLTMNENDQDEISPNIQKAEQNIPTLISLAQAVKTTFSGLTAPTAFVLAQSTLAPSPAIPATDTPVTAFALSSAVKDRAALNAGWQQIIQTVQNFSNKNGTLNPFALMPILPRTISENAVSYTLMIPFLPQIELQAAVSDKSFALSSNSKLTDKVMTLSDSASGASYRGFAAQVNFAPIADAMRQDGAPTEFDHLLHFVSGLTGAAADYQGSIVSQWRIHLQKDPLPETQEPASDTTPSDSNSPETDSNEEGE